MNENTPTTSRNGLQGLADLDLDINHELQSMTVDIQPQPPRVRIEHSGSGNHRMYLDFGDSYGDTPQQIEVPGNELMGIVIAAQPVRAYFDGQGNHPRCAAIRDTPTVDDALALTCGTCDHNVKGGPCKPKMRLLVLTTDGKLVMFPLSPTSIKHWKSHVQRLARSGAPFIAVVTRFSLQDIQKNGYRWAEVNSAFDRVISREELTRVKEIRAEADRWISNGFDRDYQDPGDRQE